MGPNWIPLQLNGHSPRIPPLLVKYEFASLGYTIHLSDLTYIWMESLERKQIVKRALNADTTIDPSESGHQLQLLLKNIEKALDGKEDATVSLTKSSVSEQLILRTTTPLPGALKPLVWPIHLVLAPQHLLTAELLQPCLSQQFFANIQIASLMQVIKEKDHVINKLTEKMQLDRTDLSKIFPGASSIRAEAKLNFRESASKFVKGLGEFDHGRWRKGLFDSHQFPSNLLDVLSQLFTPDLSPLPQLSYHDSGGAWWRDLRYEDSHESNDLNPSVADVSERAQMPAHSTTDSESGRTNDVDFQRQTTPSHTRMVGRNHSVSPTKYSLERPSMNLEQTRANSGDTTTDDSDGVLKSNSTKRAAYPSPNILSRSSTVGNAETRRPEAKNPVKHDFKHDLPAGRSSVSPNANLHEEKEAISMSMVTSSESEGLQVTAIPKSKPRLGKIGGRGKPGKVCDLSGPDNGSTKPYSRKAGDLNIEERPCVTIPTDSVDSLRKGRASLPLDSPSPKRETSMERANNRREQLKRELEKNSVSHMKKKRKF